MNKKFSQIAITGFFIFMLVTSIFILISIPFLSDYETHTESLDK
jgi:hypothetical protein